MKVPEEIRSVPRPPNTIVYAFGRDPVKYNVKQRLWVEVDGRKVQRDGPTVGAIIDGKFSPTKQRISYSEADFRSWARSQLVVNLTRDILDDLLAVYCREDAMKTYAMAILRTIEGDLKDYEMKDTYDSDYLSVLYPGIPLSKDTVGDHLFNLGRVCGRIAEFMSLRASRVPLNHFIAADGMLKSYESDDSPFSDFSRKALKTGTRDALVLFLYDVDSMEPVCSSVYPGNMNDVSVFDDFLKRNNVTRGIVVADKGFSYEAAKQRFLDNPDLHFLLPLRRDAKVIEEYRVLNTDSSLGNRYGIACRKVRMHDGRFLYAFRDTDIAKGEEQVWLEEHPEYDPADLDRFRRQAGTIVFVSDMDASPENMFAAYEQRWDLEVLFRFYKHILNMDETRVESEQSVVGTEFVNFLSVIMLSRLRKAFFSVRKLEKRSFRSNMKLLRKGIKIREGPGKEWMLSKLSEKEEGIFTELGLLPKPEEQKRKRGRPPGSKNRTK